MALFFINTPSTPQCFVEHGLRLSQEALKSSQEGIWDIFVSPAVINYRTVLLANKIKTKKFNQQ
jgi:hypothetical protein